MYDVIVTYIICLTAPIFYIVHGAVLKKTKGGKIGNTFGYRSHLSMKNETIWAHANSIYGQFLLTTGLSEGLIAFVVITTMYATISSVGGYVCIAINTVQLVSPFVIIFMVEKKLKKIDTQK